MRDGDIDAGSCAIPFYSIGENCLGHGVLERHGVEVHATPFSHSRSNIDYVVQMVESDFADMLTPALLRYDDRHNTRLGINTKYTCEGGVSDATVCNSFEFSHHDVIGKDSARDSYRRKAQRLLDGLRQDGPACFLYHYRLHDRQDIPKVAAKLRYFQDLCRARAGRPISVAMFTQRIVDADDRRGVGFARLDGIPVAILNTRRIWGGHDMDQFWGRKDDDLFARMIGAFQFHAIINQPPARRPAATRIPFLERLRAAR